MPTNQDEDSLFLDNSGIGHYSFTMFSTYFLEERPQMKSYEVQGVTAAKKKPFNPDEKLQWWWALPIIAGFSLIYGLTFIAFYKLPEPINDYSKIESFIAARAKKDLQDFVDIGPHPVGSAANEQITVMYLLNKFKEIQNESIGLYDFEVDHQVATGGFNRPTFVNLYEKIQNLIVKITPTNSTSQNGILVNAHFDTVPDARGAADDGGMVAIMLGVLSTLTKSKEVVRHPIVFLFNGAEENGLQGSHGFVSQHKWARNVSVVVNLDATGTGGKELLFQTGPHNPWLVDYYAKATKHPFASVLGAEIFENGLIPSDTDMRVFRDYGNMSGLDMSYVYNDYVYHTKFDGIDIIEDGTYQHTGDNVLGILRALGNADELVFPKEERTEGSEVFFDVFGLFMVNYSKSTGTIINIVMCIVAIATIALSMLLMQRGSGVTSVEITKQYGLSLIVQLVSFILAVGVILLIGFLVDVINYPLSWYSQPWLIFGLYFIPFILIMGIFPALFLEWRKLITLPLRFHITMFLHAHCSILVIITFVLVGLGIRSAFFLTQFIAFYAVSVLINLGLGLFMKNHLWILPILIGQMIPFAFTSYCSIITYSLFIPITGRSGSSSNPELMIGLISILYSVLMLGFIVPVFLIFRKFKTMLLVLLGVMIIFVILMFTSVCFPYRPSTSFQRQAFYHTKRVMYNFDGTVRLEDGGFYVITRDRLTAGTAKDAAKTLNLNTRRSDEECEKELLCGMPLPRPGMISYLRTGLWIETSPPNIKSLSSITLKSKLIQNGGIYRYTFGMSGTKLNEIYIKPEQGISLVGWSFQTYDEASFNKEFYIIHQRFGLERLPYDFYLDLKGANISEPAVQIAHVGHYQENDNEPTEGFKNFITAFPDWTFTQGIEATYQSYRF